MTKEEKEAAKAAKKAEKEAAKQAKEAEKTAEKIAKEAESMSDEDFPEVAGTGKFQSVKVGVGYVVYNPMGCRVTGVISLHEAKDIVLKQNMAGSHK